MNPSRLLPGVAFLLTAVMVGCDAATPVGDTAAATSTAVRSSDRCTNVRDTALAALGAPVLIPVEPFAGPGALPTPTRLGPYDGLLSSILTDEVQMGNGATEYRLVHYFDDGQGNTFWTDDRAVCSPVGNDPSTCLVNDRLTVVGGTGDFEGAGGFLHNRGLITLTESVFDPDTGITTFGTLEAHLHGRICGDGL